VATTAPFATRYAPTAMVCSVDHLASAAGVMMLRQGGSAADAAIATSAVLAVTTQNMCGMGGDLFAIVHTPGGDAPAVLNASGRAGSGADAARLRAEGHDQMPRTDDIRAVPVPGCVDGWLALHEAHGRLDLRTVLEPARAYAAAGFPASAGIAASFPRLQNYPEAADYTASGPLTPGALVRRPGVARAFDAIVARGRAGFYEGEFGENLVALGAGEYTEDDLRRVNADWVEPLAIDAWDRRIWTVPPNSQGYLTLASAWMAAGLALPDDPDDGEWAHLLVEVSRQAGFDRPAVLHEHADGAALLAPERLRARRDAVDRDRRARLPAEAYAPGGTIYLCAVDGDRMAVSLIQSNFSGWGSMKIVPKVRIFLQNRGAGFSLQPGHPAEYGPGRRPPHTLAPALVTTTAGAFDSVIGTMGGDSQPQVLLQLLARLYRHGEAVGDAVAAPRWVLSGPELGWSTWSAPDGIRVAVEDVAPADWFRGLAARGHTVVRSPAWSGPFGHAHAIRVVDDHLAAAADPRSLNGGAAGF
jgi:gamma-glutamyltranspeptidase/glutathione hydrolase